MNSIISRFLLTILFSTLSTTLYAYNFKVDGIYYTLLSDGYSVEVSNESTSTFATSSYSGNIIIPATVSYNNLKYEVTGIGAFAFYKSQIKTVSLPENILNIGQYAFAKSSELEECNIPSGVTTLGKSAFSECSKLSAIEIPSKISKLELGTFYRCYSLTKVVIPKNIMSINYSSATFVSGGALNSHDGFPCFAECKALTELIIEDSDRPLSLVDTWTGSASLSSLYASEIFYGCPLKTVFIGRSISGSSSKSLLEGSKTITEITIGDKVTSLPDQAFKDCTGIKTIVVPDAVNSLGSMSLWGCTNLTEVYIGNGVKEISYGLCAKCTNLSRVFIGNKLESIAADAFHQCNKLTEIVICSTGLSDFKANTTPTTIKFLFPAPSSIPEGYPTGVIANISGGEYTYSGTVPNFNINNCVNGTQITVSNKNIDINAGEYTHLLDFDISAENGWSSSFQSNVTYKINPAPLTVIPHNATKQYNTENPQFSGSYFGFKNDENESVLTKLPTFGTTATQTSPVGTYPIIASGAEATNYTIEYERGVLTISKAFQTIEWSQSFENVKVGDIIELTAFCSSNLPVKYSVTDETIAEIFTKNGKKYVEFLKSGSVSIRANQDGDENYYEADRLSKTVTVTAKSIIAQSLSISQIFADLIIGDELALSATILPENTSDKSLIWTSSDNTIATVSENGFVHAISEGKVKISVATTDGSNLTADCNISVSSKSSIEEINISANSHVAIYSMTGTLIYNGICGEEKLTPGSYIYVINGVVTKHIIR